MKKVRGAYPEEFINYLTEEFLSGIGGRSAERLRERIKKLREENHCAIFLEMRFAVISMFLEDYKEALEKFEHAAKLDEIVIACHEEHSRLTELMIEYDGNKAIMVAKSGGEGRAAIFKQLEDETIRLYELGKAEGKWQTGRHHVPDAALEITQKIVDFSKGKGNLLPTTNKPKEWIRAYIKRLESSPS